MQHCVFEILISVRPWLYSQRVLATGASIVLSLYVNATACASLEAILVHRIFAPSYYFGTAAQATLEARIAVIAARL